MIPKTRSGAWMASWMLRGMMLVGAGFGWIAGGAAEGGARLVVEVEEELYRHEPAQNGAGPMWCSGSTCLVRVGGVVYAAGLETIPGARPLNNCRWVLWRRDDQGWERWVTEDPERTREPSPLAAFADGRVWVSTNPTLVPPEREGGGPARPELVEVRGGGRGRTPNLRVERPGWRGEPRFSEHSYRSLAADGERGELVLFQNIDYTHAEWAFRAADGTWAAQGQLNWPWGAEYSRPQPIRVCYPNVALRGRALHFCGVSDITEPNPDWRAFKRELTGQQWDYDFRRLFYTFTPDIVREPFREWVEIASRESTCGWISPCDLSVAQDGTVWVLWTERALDERLKAKFFPGQKQSHALRLARLRDGRVLDRRTLLESTEDRPGPVVGAARFHVDGAGRHSVIRSVSGPGGGGMEWVALDDAGQPGEPVAVPLKRRFTSFFTATPRAGNAAGGVIDLLGVPEGAGNALGYARVRLEPAGR